MAEEINQLLKIEIDQKAVDTAISKAAAARQEIDRLKQANKELTKAEGDNSVAIQKNAIEIKKNSTIVRENERIVLANEKAQQSNTGSITQMREQLKIVSKQWADLSKEERENTDIGKKLSKQKLELTERLKAEEKATGDTRRNVGNYTEGVKDALKQSGLFGQTIGALEKAQYGYSVAMKGATFATSSFKKVLVSTGIGAIVVVLGSLVSYLTRTQEGMDKVSQATEAVSTFVGVLLDSLSNLGKQIFNSIIPTFKGLGDIIAGLVTFDLERLKEGVNGVKDALSGIEPINVLEVGKAAIQAAKDAARLKKEIQEINVAEADLNVERAKSRALINQLRRDSQDENNTLEERERLLKEAIGLEQEQINKSLELRKQRLDVIKQQNALTDSTEEDLQKERDLEIEIAKLEEESLNKQIELQGQLRGIEAKREAARLKAIQAADEEQRKRIEESLARLEAETQALIENDEIILENARATAEELTNIEVSRLQEQFLQGLISKEEYEQGLIDIESAALATRQLNAQLAIDEALANELLTEQERVKIITDAEAEIARVKREQSNAAVQAKLAEYDVDKQVSVNKLQLAQSVFSGVVDILGKESKAGKAFASFAALLDTYQAANNALSSSPPPFNFIQAALVTAQGIANVARINSTPEPQLPSAGGGGRGGASVPTRTPKRTRSFADGGYTGEGFGSPDSSGYKPAGIVHEGEYVVKKSIVDNPMFSGMIGQIESYRLKGYADGGFVGRAASSPVSNSQDISTLRGEIMQLSKRPIYTRVTDINRVNGQVSEVVNSSELS